MYDIMKEKRPQGQITKKAAILRGYRDRTLPLLLPHLSAQAQAAARTCGDVLMMLEDEHGHQILEGGIYCKQRMCPACAWRESARQAQALSACYDAALAQGYTLLMLTLTVPNVEADKLRPTLRRMAAAWHTMKKQKDLQVLLRHAVRKTEVTYSKRRGDFHPHYHALLAVRWGEYSHAYVRRDRLLEAWRAAYGDPSITQVDIRRCTTDGDRIGAVAEVAKYVAKAADYSESPEVFDAFYTGLKGVQMMAWGGLWRELHRAYEAGQIVGSRPDLTPYIWRVIYRWYAGYVETERSERDAKAEQLAAKGWTELVGEGWVEVIDT